MQTRNLECQLAMAQLKRYLSGSKLSDEALEALESHLVDCPVCRLAVQAQKVHTEPVLPTQAVVQTPAPTPEPKKAPLQGHLKTLALAVGLATVLIAMSMIANDPTKLFGERLQSSTKPPTTTVASKPQPTKSQPTKAETSSSDSVPTPVVGSAETSRPEPKPAPTTSVVEAAPEEPEPEATSKPIVRQKAKAKPVRRAPAAKTQAVPSGIKVYDPNGNPI